MLNVMKIRTYPFKTRAISVPTNEEKPYNVIFMSENSNFIKSYPKLNIRRQFVKKITILPFKNPRLIVTMKTLMPYKSELSLLPSMQETGGHNIYIDTIPFFNALDAKYGRKSYKRPMVFEKIVSYLNEAKSFGGSNSILIYHVDLNKEIPNHFLYRRSVVLALMSKIGSGMFPFDCVVLAIESGGSISYSSIYNKNQKTFSFSKIMAILKKLSNKEEDVIVDDPELVSESVNYILDEDEKQSILSAISIYQKGNKKVLTS